MRAARQIFAWIVLPLFFAACSPSDRALVEKGDREALNQRAQLAKYLYLQVIENHSARDETRMRALEGLAEVSRTQLYDYAVAAAAFDRLISEFEPDPAFRTRASSWRITGAQLARLHLMDLDKAEALISPLATHPQDLSATDLNEMGKLYLLKREFDKADGLFERAWDMAAASQGCGTLRTLQLEIIQNFSLSRRCEKSLDWAEKKLPGKCTSDQFSIDLEKANCYESTNEPAKATKIFEKMIEQNPRNPRPHFMLEALKQRQREKQIR